MTERRYSEDEVAAIFRKATEDETSLTQPVAGQGMTLRELQSIGQELGIAPALVAQAALSLEHSGLPSTRTFLGLPIGVARTIELGRRLTDGEWDQLVVALRETFNARGQVSVQGSLRQWTNGNLQALVEPTPSGHRFRLQTVKGDSRGSLGNSGSVVGVEFLAAMGLGMFAVGAVRLPGWARLRRTQIEAVTARLAIAAETPSRDDRKPERDPS